MNSYSSARYKHVMEYLIEQINDGILNPGDRIPSAKQLCKIFSYTPPSISNALKHLEASGYIIKQWKGNYIIADRKPKHITNNISIITPYDITPAEKNKRLDIRPKIIETLKKEISDLGYNAVVNINNNDKYQNLNYLSELNKGKVDGIIYYDDSNDTCHEILKKYEKNKSPIVCIDNYDRDINIPVVTSDNSNAIDTLLETYLIPSGYERIFCISVAAIHTTLTDRENGYKQAVAKHKRRQEIIYIDFSSAEFSHKLVEEYINRLYYISKNQKTAVIFLTPGPTKSLWNYTMNSNLPLDNFCWCSFDHPDIDYPENIEYIEIIQDINAMAKAAAKTIANMIDDNLPENQIEYIPCHFQTSRHFKNIL